MPDTAFGATRTVPPLWTRLDTFLLLLACLCALCASSLLHFPLTDSFHFGEFFAAALSMTKPLGNSPLPFTIHGGADVFPYLILKTVYGHDNNLIAKTALSYGGLSAIANLLMILTLISAAGVFHARAFWLLPFALFAQDAIGFRDLFFAVNFLIFVQLCKTPRNTASLRWLFSTMLGACLALGLLWTHDRGLVSLAIFMLPLLALRLGLGPIFLALFAFAFTLTFLAENLQGFSLNQLIENILFLVRTGGQWRYPTDLSVVGLAGVSVAVNGGMLLVLGRRMYAFRAEPAHFAILLCVALCLLAFMKIGLNRVDLQHAKMTLWAPLFALPLVVSKDQAGVFVLANHSKVRIFLGLFAVALAPLFLNTEVGRFLFVPFLLICLITANAVPSWLQKRLVFLAAALSFAFLLTNIIRPARAMLSGKTGFFSAQNWSLADNQAVSDPIVWAANTLRNAGAPCVFDMTNSGLINAYAKLPACTQFSYPVYAGSQDEASMLGAIVALKPAAVVISGTVDAFAIDGVPMPKRFPVLAARLEQDYSRQMCQFGFCIGYLTAK